MNSIDLLLILLLLVGAILAFVSEKSRSNDLSMRLDLVSQIIPRLEHFLFAYSEGRYGTYNDDTAAQWSDILYRACDGALEEDDLEFLFLVDNWINQQRWFE